ncbi:unnamed protein product, partial [Laminaria digitata]
AFARCQVPVAIPCLSLAMVASKLLRLAAAAATTAVASCFASPVICCRGARSTALVSNSLSPSSAAADMMFSVPAALQRQQQQHQRQQQQQQQQQQSQGASAARLGRLVAVAGVGRRRRALGRFHALTSRPATASSSTEESLFTRGGGVGGVPTGAQE